MISLASEAKAQKIWFDDDKLWVSLFDGWSLSIPLGTGQSGRPHTISASNVNAAINGHSIHNFQD